MEEGKKDKLALLTSHDTLVLVDTLKSLPVGEVATYEELSRALGRPVTSTTYPLTAARRILAKEHGISIGIVRGIGAKRRTTQEIAEMPQSFILKTGKGSRRMNKHVIVTIKVEEIPPADLPRFLASMSTARAIASATHGLRQNRLIEKIREKQLKMLNPSMTVKELFKLSLPGMKKGDDLLVQDDKDLEDQEEDQ